MSNGDEYVGGEDEVESVEVLDEGDPPTQPISVKCRAKRLFDVIPKLNQAQRSAAVRTGFGGMLGLKFEKFPLQHVPLFLDAFKDGIYVFRASESKEFMVTKHDVHDCFLIPFGPKPLDLVPTGQMSGSNSPENKVLKDRWRKKFGIKSPKGSIPIGTLKKAIEADTEQGDNFCRLFVLLCMSSFLAPTWTDGVDFRLLRAVENVGEIHELDWCSYVLKSIVTAGEYVKKRHIHLLGCIPFLMITYFQRFDYRGEISAHDLPLIKHWDEDRLKRRIKGEVADGGLGRQALSMVKYPRCIHATTTPPLTVTDNRQLVLGSTSCPQPGKRFIQIELPEGVEDDDQLKARAIDDLHEQYLMIQRNTVVFHSWYTHSISRIKDVTSGNMNPLPLVPSQSTQGFWECAELHGYCDEVEQVAKRMKESVAKAPSLPQPSAQFNSKREDDLVNVQVNSAIHDLINTDLELHASPAKSSSVDENVQLGNDELIHKSDGTIPDEIITSDCLYTTAEINNILLPQKIHVNAELEVLPNEPLDMSDRALLEEADYTPAEVDDSLRLNELANRGANDAISADDLAVELGRTTEVGVTHDHAAIGDLPLRTDTKRMPDEEPESEVTYKRRRSSTPDPATLRTNDGAVNIPVPEPLSAVGSRRNSR